MYSRLIPSILGLLASCGGAPMVDAEEPTALGETVDPSSIETGAEPRSHPAQIAREFWGFLANRDYDSAAALASYPFDLDAHQGCIGSAEEMRQAFADDFLPPELELIVEEIHPISADMDLSELHHHWHERIPSWTGPDAICLGDSQVEGSDVEFVYLLVDFTVNGRPVGALTRLRCFNGACTVAGTDN